MAAITESISDLYNYTLESRDLRTKPWISSHPLGFTLIEVSYLLFCLHIGPWFMKRRPPYKLQYVIRAYDIFQVILNLYLLHEGFNVLFFSGYNFRCQGVDFSHNDWALRTAAGVWWFYFSRVMDMLDTVFFTLRKKNNHLSFLHIYHHALMVFGTWLCVAYYPGGNGVITGTLNSFVHTLMYSYYFITSLGPEYKRFIWWKKYLTQLQILQFVIVGIHAFQAIFRDCSFPRSLTGLLLGNAVLFIYLFSQFYVNTYLRPKSNDKKK